MFKFPHIRCRYNTLSKPFINIDKSKVKGLDIICIAILLRFQSQIT